MWQLWLACAPEPPTEAEATRIVSEHADLLFDAERRVGIEVDQRFDRFVCRPPDGTFQRQDSPICIDQRGTWERARLGHLGELGPALGPLIEGPIAAIGVLIVGAGEASAGERPTPAVQAEQGPRVEGRMLGWGSDRTGRFVETLRKARVGDTDIAIRIVLRPTEP